MPRKQQYTEADVAAAIEAVQNGKSLRYAAATYAIPRTTLQNRLNSGQPHNIAHEGQQRLSNAQEEIIAEWMLCQDALGCTPTHAELQCIATKVLEAQGDSNPVGKRWSQNFLNRHPHVKAKLGRRTNRQHTPPPKQSDDIATPTSSQEVRSILESTFRSPSARPAIHKTVRMFEKIEAKIALAQREIDDGRAELEAIRSAKRRKIQNPNERFMTPAGIALQRGLEPEQPINVVSNEVVSAGEDGELIIGEAPLRRSSRIQLQKKVFILRE
ncbi:hypothetical protein ABW20_dc0100068 [Dactylellina cionopaga]|nr:hypothetical protein ABW20_dc0100068 [Dactylellina cionopaga]